MSDEQNITLNIKESENKELTEKEKAEMELKKKFDMKKLKRRQKKAKEEAEKKAKEEAEKKAKEEAITNAKAEEEAITNAKAEEEEMEKEMIRLKNITDNLWKKGQTSNWESLSHTNSGADKYDILIRSNNMQNQFMNFTKYRNISFENNTINKLIMNFTNNRISRTNNKQLNNKQLNNNAVITRKNIRKMGSMF